MNTTMVWAGMAIFFVFSFLTAMLSRQGKASSMDAYFLGNRKLNGFVSALSYSSTTYSAFMMVGLAGLTYTGGVGAFGFEIVYFIGVTLILIFGPRFWLVGKKFGYITPSEMIGDRYQSKLSASVISLVSCLFLIPYSAVQLTGVGYLLSGITNQAIPFMAGVVIATFVAILFSLIAGIRSVVWTDSLQALVMIVSSTVVVLLVVSKLGGFGAFFQDLQSNHPEKLSVPGNGYFNIYTFINLTVPWFFFSISNPQVSQRLFMPSSKKAMRQMLLGFLIFGFIYTLVSVMWGYSALIKFPNLEKPDLATPMLLSSDLVPSVLGLIVMIGILAAAISTIDSILLTLSSLFSRDIYGYMKKDTDDRQQLRVGKIVIPIIAVLAFVFATLELDLIAVLSVASSAGLIVSVPSIIGAFFWKRGTSAGTTASVIVGAAVVLFMQFTGIAPLKFGAGVWGLTVSAVVFIVVSLFTEPPKEKAHAFMDELREKLREKS
ncbi:MAG TPA: pantothenate permease [Clostridiales bacterium]|nr:pantothenate permease [Clostridiales bacterium]